jgi:hypothetical protein
MYAEGRGAPQDFSQAAAWYQKAAERGDPDAQDKLARMYAAAQGVPLDYVRAHMWFNLAASRYTAADAEKRDGAIFARDSIAAWMTPSQIAEAQRLAAAWTATPQPK